MQGVAWNRCLDADTHFIFGYFLCCVVLLLCCCFFTLSRFRKRNVLFFSVKLKVNKIQIFLRKHLLFISVLHNSPETFTCLWSAVCLANPFLSHFSVLPSTTLNFPICFHFSLKYPNSSLVECAWVHLTSADHKLITDISQGLHAGHRKTGWEGSDSVISMGSQPANQSLFA